MRVSLDEICWCADLDIVADSGGREYRLVSITQSPTGRLRIDLDADPVSDTITYYQDGYYDWHAINFFSRDIDLDESILMFCKELQASIPPLRRD